MQIEIDFGVFKALTALRESESDSYNAVLRRLLELPMRSELQDPLQLEEVKFKHTQRSYDSVTKYLDEVAEAVSALKVRPVRSANSTGAWFDNVCFPNGTQFRASYKGQLCSAEIRDGRWVDQSGAIRTSPSAAASAISNTNVNGWRFWHALLPGDTEWKRLDAFKS